MADYVPLATGPCADDRSFPTGLVSAFLAGVVSLLSPCVLPLVPAYLSCIGGSSLPEGEATESKSRTIPWQTL
ncbi:cytochrome c biogenesis CcdA family protein [Vreelandella nanhaiensis]|uniref:cytochrome c biogenesis CcdA family protein n=1 Tax=Vreelandella nanhaiensis TaxID=1258546 RepID=UPI003BF4E6B4